MRYAWMLVVLLSVGALAAPQSYSISPYTDFTLNRPWALVALPDDQFIVTEKQGALVLIDKNGEATRQQQTLPSLYSEGQGGLLDLALAQDYAISHRVLISYSKGTADSNQLVVASAILEKGTLNNIEQILAVTPAKDTPVHFGGRLAVLDDGTWLVTTGDGFDYREQAQVKTSQLGKILRFREDGSAPQSPPFADAPYVYSQGHRNTQGLIVKNNEVIAHEHGPAGGDEINLIEEGANYGWPVATMGDDYSGARISPFRKYEGMKPPLVNWTPSVAPSGMIDYSGEQFPYLAGKLLVTTLKEKALLAVDLRESPPRIEHIFSDVSQRLRDVNVSSDGAILLLTDGEEATLLKVSANSQ